MGEDRGMKLNLSILSEKLAENYAVRSALHRTQALTLCRPVLYEVGTPMEQDTLYVGKDDMLPETPPPSGAAVICVGTKLPRNWEKCSCPLLVLSGSYTVSAVFNAVQEIFDQFDQWERNLLLALSAADFDFEHFLRLGMEMLQNPVFISDVALRYRVASTFQKTGGGIEWQVCLRPTSLETERMRQMKDYCVLERKLREPFLSGMQVISPEDETCRVYCYNIYLEDRFVACVVLAEFFHRFCDGDFAIADFFFPLLQQAYMRFLLYDVEAAPGNQILHKLLRHESLSAEEHSRLQLTGEQGWMCFKLTEDRSGRSLQMDYTCAVVRSQLPDTCFVNLDAGTILGLLKVQKRAGRQDESISALQWICQRMGYYGGFSGCFSDICQLAQSFRQADFAVKACRRDGKTKTVFFQDRILDYILSEVDREQSFEALTSKGLAVLLEHDRKKGSEYLKTLDVWLKHETNVSQAAAELFIHRSSMQSRLERIEELTGEDFSDPRIRLYYRIYFAVQNHAAL